jgi:hypothetical protein
VRTSLSTRNPTDYIAFLGLAGGSQLLTLRNFHFLPFMTADDFGNQGKQSSKGLQQIRPTWPNELAPAVARSSS